MKRFFGAFLAFCLLVGCGAAWAEEWTCEVCAAENDGNFCANCGSARPAGTWDCPNCGQTDNEGNFCGNCGTAKGGTALPEVGSNGAAGDALPQAALPQAALPQAELNGDQLTYYYMNAVRTATDRHGRYQSYLTNIMRWRDGVEETSGLAVAVYDLHTNGVQIFAASNILSDGCDYAWQTHRERYFVEPARVQNACGLAVFVLRESDEAEIVDEWNLSYAACPFYGPGEDEGKVRIYYFGVDEARERLIAKEQWAKVVGYEDHGEYQTISLADDEGYADSYALYQNDLEEASAWWKSGVCGILVNADGSICGVHVEGVGMVSLLTLSDENFYGGVGSSERDIPDPGDVFGVSLLRTQELDGMTGRVYELPEGYGSTREIYAKYAAPLLDQGFPISAGWSDEWDSIVVSNTYAFEDEDIEAVLFVVGDENLVFLERTSPEAEINPWDGLESMGWDLETYRYRTY